LLLLCEPLIPNLNFQEEEKEEEEGAQRRIPINPDGIE